MKVLVIEDNKADQRLLQEMFRDMNMPAFELVFAENLTKGIAYLDSEDIGIVILDLGLPESQGLDTFLRLKAHAENASVIVLTGLDDTGIARNSLKEGAQDYLIKGWISTEILKKSIIYAIERQRLIEELRQSNREILFKEERFRILIEENADAMVVLSKTEGVQYQNPAAELLFEGASADYFKNPSFFPFEGGKSIERTLDFPAGIQKIIEIRGVPIEWERLPAFLLTIRDITERKRAEEKIERLNRVLRALRNVNQLITKENNRDKLLKGACDNLTETRGYSSAWIALYDDNGTLLFTTESGLGTAFLPVLERLQRCELTECGHHVLRQPGLFIKDPSSDCADCPLATTRAEKVALAARLEYGAKTYGMLVISYPTNLTPDREEQSLFQELVDDIAFGLYKIEMEEQRKKAEETIESLAKFPTENPNPIFRIAHDGILLFANKSAEFILNEWRLSVGTKVPEFLETILKEGLESGSQLELEKTAGERTYLFTLAPIIGQNYVNLYGLDITVRKKAEEERKTSLAKYKVLFESFPLAITVSDNLGNIVESNRRAEELLGLSLEEQSKRKIDGTEWQLIRPDGTPMPADEYASVRALKENRLVQNVEMGIVKGNSAVTWINVTAAPIPLKDYGVAIAYGDITERKRMEQELRESEERYRLLFNSIDEGFCIIEVIFDENEKPIDYRFLEINPSFEKQTGLIDAQGRRMRELAPKHEEYWFEIYGKIAVTGQPARFVNRAEQLHRWYDVYAFRLGQPENRQVAILFNDITERKRVEEELKKSTRLLTDVGEMAKVGGWELDLSTKEVSLTEEVSRIHGVEPGYKLNLEEAKNFYAPKSRPALEVVLKKAAETGEPYDLESLFIPSGSKDKIWVRSLGKAIYSDGKIVKLAGTFQNIDKYKRAEETLRETNEYLHKLIDYASAPIMVWDPRFLITRFNEAFEHLTGRTEQEVLGQKIDVLFPEESREASLALIKKTLEGERWESVKIPILTADGTIHTVLWNSANILTADAELVSTIAQGVDITQSEMAEKELRESENRYRHVVEDQTEFICRFTPGGKLTFVNDAYCRYFGLKREGCIGKRHSVVLPPDDVSLMKKHIQSLTQKNPVGFIEHRIIMPSGEVRWQRWSDRVIFDKDGHVVEYQSVGKDITDRKQAEEEIRVLNRDLERRVEERTSQLNQTLGEKETLLKEIHHRVKNNLQIIASLLNLQSQYIKDEKTLAVIKDSQNRIKAMALIHEKIYQSKSLDRIDYGDYLEKITRSLFESYGVNPKKIAMKIHAKNIFLHIDKAIPCSLIINELLSNSFKHAFPNDRTGEVRIDVQLEGDTLHLLYSDNGIGLPESVTLDHTGSLGMRLISGLIQQLKGTVEIQRGGGTTFVIAFKV